MVNITIQELPSALPIVTVQGDNANEVAEAYMAVKAALVMENQ